MTVLAQVVWDCPAIRGMDKLVLMGWAEQVEDGMDVAYCSKTTVADFLGVSLDSIKRRTHALVAGGWMVDTGGRKQWEPDCWTPVYRINLEKLVELDFGGANCTGGAEKAGVQIAPQGSGSRSWSSPFPPSSATSTAADLRSVGGSAPNSKAVRQTENPKTQDQNRKSKPVQGAAILGRGIRIMPAWPSLLPKALAPTLMMTSWTCPQAPTPTAWVNG